jgi:ATP-binding cassette subfamily C protein LapB
MPHTHPKHSAGLGDTSRTKLARPAWQLVWTELMREPGWVLKVVVATLMVNLLGITTSLFAMQVYDRVVPTLAYATLTTLVVGMGLILVMDWVLKILRARILDSVAIGVDKRVSQQVFEHLLQIRLDLQPKSLGSLAAQIGGLDSIRQFFSASIVFGLVDLPFALMFIAFIGLIGGKVAWVYLGLLPLALLLGLGTQRRLRQLTRAQLARSNERQGLLVDSIRGAETIRASHAGWRFAQEWQAITASIDGSNIQQKAINNLSATTTSSLSTLAYVAAIVVGVWQIEAGLLTVGGLIACSILGGRVIAPIAQGVQYLTQWQGIRQALDLIDHVLQLELERRPGQKLLIPDPGPVVLAIKDLRFSYPNSAVQQVNIAALEFKPGDRVLLAGPVGSGKSSLLKILAGLYRPAEGRVRLGDADLWELEPQAVAKAIGYLPQSPQLFKGSLRLNLALCGGTNDHRLLKIARDLGVDAIASQHPLGMDLSVSEGGMGLSGGQKQLVALARVVIAQPRIWLLDEPTAALDNEHEARVWAVLKGQLRPEDILIVATHRPMQALKIATRVLLMRQGQVLQDGTPETVMPLLYAAVSTERPTVPQSASSPNERSIDVI